MSLLTMSTAQRQEGLTNVQNLALANGIISWSGPNGDDHAKVIELVFVLGEVNTSKESTKNVLAFLKEDAENGGDPFQLLLLATDKIPESLHDRYRINSLPPYLSPVKDKHEVDFVVSTKSGIGRSLQFWQVILQPLWNLLHGVELQPATTSAEDSSATPNVLITQDAQSVREFARGLKTSSRTIRSRTIILLSGDGGIVDLINGSPDDRTSQQEHRPQTLLALVPLGTGNATFHSLHKPLLTSDQQQDTSPLVLGLRTLFGGVAANLPIFRVSFPSGSRIVQFTPTTTGDHTKQADQGKVLTKSETEVSYLNSAVVVSYGFHASIVYESDTPEYRVHGDKRFGMVAQKLLEESHPYLAKVEIRGPSSTEFEILPGNEHGYVLMTPLSNMERTFEISPASKPLDGQLRLVHFGPIDGKRTMDVMMKAYDGGKHVGLKWDDGHKVRYEEVDEVKVTVLEENERWRKVCVDGTTVDIPHGGQLSVRKEKGLGFQVLVDPRVLSNI